MIGMTPLQTFKNNSTTWGALNILFLHLEKKFFWLKYVDVPALFVSLFSCQLSTIREFTLQAAGGPGLVPPPPSSGWWFGALTCPALVTMHRQAETMKCQSGSSAR